MNGSIAHDPSAVPVSYFSIAGVTMEARVRMLNNLIDHFTVKLVVIQLGIDPMLGRCYAIVVDGGPTMTQHWVNLDGHVFGFLHFTICLHLIVLEYRITHNNSTMA